jgi:hypothetical protein
MTPVAIGCIIFACIFGGALVGMILRAALPEHHLSPDSKDVVKLGMGLIGTMTALVLGLLIASAKSSFDTQRNGVAQLAANVIVLDPELARYGSCTASRPSDSSGLKPACHVGRRLRSAKARSFAERKTTAPAIILAQRWA